MEQLSKSEKQIMNSFWNSTSPLTANDLLSVCIGRTYYEGEVRYENGTIEELENAQVKHWSVDNGVLVLEIK